MDKNALKNTVEKAQKGDIVAFEVLFNSYSKSVYYSAYKILRHEQAAQDVTQEVFSAVYTNIVSLKKPEAFSSWIMRITAFQCGHVLRNNKERFLPDGEIGDSDNCFVSESESELPEAALECASTADIISKIIDILPLEQRTAVIMYYYNEMSVREIAKALNASESAIKSRLQYARKKIKQDVLKTERKDGIRLHSVGGTIAAALAGDSGHLKLSLSKFIAPAATVASAANSATSAVGFAATAANMLIATAVAKAAAIIASVAVLCITGAVVAVPVMSEITSQVTLSEIQLNDIHIEPGQSAEATFELTVLINKEPVKLNYTASVRSNAELLDLNSETLNKLDAISFTLLTDGDAIDADGLIVRAIKNGTATLSIQASLYDSIINTTAKATVTTPASGVSTTSKLELVEGKSASVNAKALPENSSDKIVLYESLDNSIATVDENGIVTAIKNGQTKIKSCLQNFSTFTDVVVTPLPVGIAVSATKTTLLAGESTTLSVLVTPDNYVGNLVYKSKNENIIIVDENGKVSAVSQGSADIIVTVDGYELSKEINFTVNPKQITSAIVAKDTQAPSPTATPTNNAAPETAPSEQHYHGNGTDFGHCTICGQVYNQTNLPVGGGTEHAHVWTYSMSTEAECMSWGVDIYVCECTLICFPITYPPTAHDFMDWEVKITPTATEPGLRSRFCGQCLHEEEESIPIIG